MLTVRQLDEMSQLDPDQIEKTGLVDIRSVIIDASLSPEQRMIDYLDQIKNPYCFLFDGATVRIRFDSTGGELKNKLKGYLISMKTQ